MGEEESLCVLCREGAGVSRGVDVPGVPHGEETRGGLGSYVNMDAILTGLVQSIPALLLFDCS